MQKVIFFGTSKFAIPSLQKLSSSIDFEIAGVVTQPDRPAGRKRQLLPSPVKLEAQKLNLKILQPEKLGDIAEELKNIHADVFIVASYGQIIPKAILDLPKLGTINIHPSLLPKYRGPSPIQQTILNGDELAGVTIMILDEEMDHGSILSVKEVKINKDTVTFGQLQKDLSDEGAELLLEVLPELQDGSLKATPQDHTKATYTKKISKDDAKIDWTKGADEIDRMIRAFSTAPVAWTTLGGKRLKIFSASPLNVCVKEGRPGEILDAQTKLTVKCSSDENCQYSVLELTEVQLESGKKMPVKIFLNGQKQLPGKILQ